MKTAKAMRSPTRHLHATLLFMYIVQLIIVVDLGKLILLLTYLLTVLHGVHVQPSMVHN
jgi:hypothetical protein